MPDSLLSAARRVLGDERGMALPFALGVTVILSALAAGIFTYVTTNQGATRRVQADQRAYGLAESGLSYAFSRLENAADPLSSSSVPSTTVTLPTGTVTYSGTLLGSTWTLTGTGTVTNPSGPDAANVVRTVSAQAAVTTTSVPDARPWDYLFIDHPSGCFTLTNTVTVEISLYVRGDLCIQNNVLIKSPAVHVLGNVFVSNSASIGTSTIPITEFRATGSCYYAGTLTTCGPPARIWANTVGTNPPNITKSPLDLNYWYASADLGPMSNCTPGYGTGSFPGGFDNDLSLNLSRGTVDVTPSTAYDCQKRDASGNLVAQIKWVPGSNPSQTGNLTIKGTIFFDGHVTWSNLNKIQYDGRATIFMSGQLVIQNQAQLCGVSACDATWNPSQDFLVFVAASIDTTPGSYTVSGDVGNNVNFQGAVYLAKDYNQSNNTTIWGPVITRNATITNSGLFKALPAPFGDLVPGMPAATQIVTSVDPVQGSYSG